MAKSLYRHYLRKKDPADDDDCGGDDE